MGSPLGGLGAGARGVGRSGGEGGCGNEEGTQEKKGGGKGWGDRRGASRGGAYWPRGTMEVRVGG